MNRVDARPVRCIRGRLVTAAYERKQSTLVAALARPLFETLADAATSRSIPGRPPDRRHGKSGRRQEARPAGQGRPTRPKPGASPVVTGARRSDTRSRGRPHLSEPAMPSDGVLPELAEVEALIAEAEAELAVLRQHLEREGRAPDPSDPFDPAGCLESGRAPSASAATTSCAGPARRNCHPPRTGPPGGRSARSRGRGGPAAGPSPARPARSCPAPGGRPGGANRRRGHGRRRAGRDEGPDVAPAGGTRAGVAGRRGREGRVRGGGPGGRRHALAPFWRERARLSGARVPAGGGR